MQPASGVLSPLLRPVDQMNVVQPVPPASALLFRSWPLFLSLYSQAQSRACCLLSVTQTHRLFSRLPSHQNHRPSLLFPVSAWISGQGTEPALPGTDGGAGVWEHTAQFTRQGPGTEQSGDLCRSHSVSGTDVNPKASEASLKLLSMLPASYSVVLARPDSCSHQHTPYPGHILLYMATRLSSVNL